MMNRLIAALVAAIFWLAVPATAQRSYGAGTPGAGGLVPDLTCPQAWMGNAGFGCTLSNGLGQAQAVMAFSLASGYRTFGITEVHLSLSPAHFLGTMPLPLGGTAGLPGSGSGFVPIPLSFAVNPALAGFTFYAQGFVLDFPAPASVAATPGLEIELRMPPLVFAATTGGGAGIDFLVDPLTGVATASNGPATAVDDALFFNAGLDLVTARADEMSHAAAATTPPVWSTAFGSGCRGAERDAGRGLLYTMTSTSVGFRLQALDGDPTSPTFGQLFATSSAPVGNNPARVALAPSGNFAITLDPFPPSALHVVDTDPASATYMDTLYVATVPLPGFQVATNVVISPDEHYALVVTLGMSTQVSRLDLTTQAWFDHDPGQPGIQAIGPFSSPPLSFGDTPWGMQYGHDGTFVMLAGGTLNQPGWVAQLDLDPAVPTTFSMSYFFPAGVTLRGTQDVALSPDESVVAFGTDASGAMELVLVDRATGSLLSRVTLPGAATFLRTIAYR